MNAYRLMIPDCLWLMMAVRPTIYTPSPFTGHSTALQNDVRNWIVNLRYSWYRGIHPMSSTHMNAEARSSIPSILATFHTLSEAGQPRR